MPQFLMPTGSREAGCAFNALDAFTRGYIEAMFFTETGSADDKELATFADLAPETLAGIIDSCRVFQADNREDLDEALDNGRIHGYDDQQAGHDFWYTRNHHGVGFWDSDLGQVGADLTDAAHKWREVDLYLGDDGKLYLS